MSEQAQERFNLSDFVLGYLEEAGSIVMPPEFGIYDVLMPDDIAQNLTIDEHARLAFGASTPDASTPVSSPQNGELDNALRLGVSHPLVENIAQTLTSQSANMRAYIRGVRTDKRGLLELARKHYGLANARVDELPKTQEEATQHHYLLCNFKVTFLSEEKQEDLVPVIMDVQGGYAVEDEVILQRLAILDTVPAFGGLAVSQPVWQGAGGALDPKTLQALLPRAERALRQKLDDQATALATRMERHLDLDLARIGDYYDEMAADLQKRQGRLSTGDERRQDFDDKLATLEAERTAKLSDAYNRYSLRVEMKLVNALLATQAKVDLPVSISNRTAKITRTVVWDPLRHQLEPLLCDVCGDPGGDSGEKLHLCTGGHLAHEACLPPQCIDCKREFCQLCADKLLECVVCHRPVCQPSLIKCPTCSRGTCNEHQQLCHAADGQPAVLPEPTAPVVTPSVEQAQSASNSGRQNGKTSVTPRTNKSTNKSRNKSSGGTKSKRPAPKPKTAPSVPVVKGARIDVQLQENDPIIVAFVMKSTSRVLATRSFELTPEGILVHCQCEKSPCPAHGYYYRPFPDAAITKQIGEQLQKLQREYLVPTKKIKFLYKRFNQVQEEKRLTLSGPWRNAAKLAEARRGFDELSD